jgi:two-component system, NarL family, response regulator DesR
MIRLVLAEDQAMVRGALSALLRLEGDIEVLAEVGDGEAALAAVALHQPDLLLTDIEMPLLTGLDLAVKLRAEKSPTRVVILTTFARSGYLKRALQAGVRGYLLKEAPASKLAESIRLVAAGGRAVDPELALEAAFEDDPLSERERQVLKLAGEGMAANDIAEKLHLSHGTVRNYLSEAISKMGVSNRIEAYRHARNKGWL